MSAPATLSLYVLPIIIGLVTTGLCEITHSLLCWGSQLEWRLRPKGLPARTATPALCTLCMLLTAVLCCAVVRTFDRYCMQVASLCCPTLLLV